MKEPLFSRILKYALYTAFAAGIVFAISLPFMFETYVYITHGTRSVNPDYRAFIVPFLMVVGAFCLWAVMEMILMLHSIPKDPFVMRNVKALNRIGVIFLLVSAGFFVKCFMWFTLLTMFCFFLFIGAGLFAFTLAALIRQSIVFREENELTI